MKLVHVKEITREQGSIMAPASPLPPPSHIQQQRDQLSTLPVPLCDRKKDRQNTD